MNSPIAQYDPANPNTHREPPRSKSCSAWCRSFFSRLPKRATKAIILIGSIAAGVFATLNMRHRAKQCEVNPQCESTNSFADAICGAVVPIAVEVVLEVATTIGSKTKKVINIYRNIFAKYQPHFYAMSTLGMLNLPLSETVTHTTLRRFLYGVISGTVFASNLGQIAHLQAEASASIQELDTQPDEEAPLQGEQPPLGKIRLLESPVILHPNPDTTGYPKTYLGKATEVVLKILMTGGGYLLGRKVTEKFGEVIALYGGSHTMIITAFTAGTLLVRVFRPQLNGVKNTLSPRVQSTIRLIASGTTGIAAGLSHLSPWMVGIFGVTAGLEATNNQAVFENRRIRPLNGLRPKKGVIIGRSLINTAKIAIWIWGATTTAPPARALVSDLATVSISSALIVNPLTWYVSTRKVERIREEDPLCRRFTKRLKNSLIYTFSHSTLISKLTLLGRILGPLGTGSKLSSKIVVTIWALYETSIEIDGARGDMALSRRDVILEENFAPVGDTPLMFASRTFVEVAVDHMEEIGLEKVLIPKVLIP